MRDLTSAGKQRKNRRRQKMSGTSAEPFQSPSKGIVLAALALVFVEERLASFTSCASNGPPVIGKEAIKP